MTADKPFSEPTADRRLRIAYFTTNFPKLSEIFTLNQVLALLDRGHDVHIYALTNPHESRTQPGTERIPAADIHDAGMPRNAFARFAALPRLLARNRFRQVQKCLDPRRQDIEAVTLRNLFRLDSVRGGLPAYDIVHAQLGNVARQCALLKQMGFFHAPLLATFRGSDLSRHLAHGRSGAYDDVFAECAFCLPVAARWVDSLAGIGCPREKILHLPVGIPVSSIPARSLDRWGEGEFPRIISACRLEHYKGIHLGLEAFRLLLLSCPNAVYEIFGDGPDRKALEAKSRRLGIAERVRFHGPAHNAEILDALARFDLHWFTTVTGADGRTEGVPTILKETQAAGLPAVAFDHPGVDEAVLRGETGLLVPEGDVQALVQATMRLAADGDLARRLGAYARIRARENYDLERITDRLEQVYHAAIEAEAAQIS